MTDSLNNQWLVFGWPLSNQETIRDKVDASLHEPGDKGRFDRINGTIPAEEITHNLIKDIEISPGVLALHKAPPTQRSQFRDHILTEDTERHTRDSPWSLQRLRKFHSSWNFAIFIKEIARIQRAALRSDIQPGSPVRTMTGLETAREIAHQLAIHFGFDVLQNATHSYKIETPRDNDLLYQITFESPVETAPLLRGAIELYQEGGIALTLWYRFSPHKQWHEYANDSFNGFDGFDLHTLLELFIIELVTLADYGLTYSESITHLGIYHDLAEHSEWSRHILNNSDTLSYQREFYPKLEEILFI